MYVAICAEVSRGFLRTNGGLSETSASSKLGGLGGTVGEAFVYRLGGMNGSCGSFGATHRNRGAWRSLLIAGSQRPT